MKKLLLLIPLLMMSGCSSNKVYINVSYNFSYEDKCYVVETDDEKKYHVNVEDYHEIRVDSYKRDKNNKIIYNEFYTNNKVLWVYNQ